MATQRRGGRAGAAAALRDAGATLVAGRSAHVPHDAGRRVLYDLGDFLDDYAIDRELRNDLGLLFLVELAENGAIVADAIPLALEFCHTRLATATDAALVADHLARACKRLGTCADVIDRRARVALD